MSLYFEIVTELPSSEVLKRFPNIHPDHAATGPFEEVKNDGFKASWRFGSCSVRQVPEDIVSEIREVSGVGNPRTRIFLHCDLREEGEDAVYQIAAAAIREWPGDFALLINGDYLALQRLSGRLILFAKFIDQRNLNLFQLPAEIRNE